MADTTHSDVAYIMKRRYSDRASAEVAMRDHPTWYQIAKAQSFDGADFRYPVTTGNPQSIGATFTAAQGQAGGNAALKGEVFAAEPKLKYGVLKLDGPSMQRARGSKGSFYDFVTRHADGMLEELGADIAFDLMGDGNGIRGRIATGGISGNVITLESKIQVDRFKRGMTIGASSNSDGSSPRSGTTYITKLDRESKKITLNSAAAITGLAAGDYLFRDADPAACIEGMEKTTPLATPTTSDSFRGVNRSNDAEALAGSRLDNTALYPEQIFGDLAVKVHVLHKRLRVGVVYPTVFQEMVTRLNAKVEYVKAGGNADIGFEAITIYAAGAALRIMSDPDARHDRARAWDPKTHEYKHLDEVVHWIRTSGGGQSQWSTSTDGIEMRARTHGNYIQHDPSCHAVGSLPA